MLDARAPFTRWGFARADDIGLHRGAKRDIFEDRTLGPNVVNVGRGHGVGPTRFHAQNPHQSCRLAVGQRGEQHRVQYREDHGVGADSDRQGEQCHRGEHGLFAKQAEGEAHVLPQPLEPSPTPGFEAFFVQPGGISELAPGGTWIGGGRFQLQVMLHLFGQVGLEAPPVEEELQSSPELTQCSHR